MDAARKGGINGGTKGKMITDSSSILDESEMALLQERVKALREENIDLHKDNREKTKENDFLEKNLIEVKMQWATMDHENEELSHKLNQKNQQLKIFSSQVTKLEIDLVKAKNDLGEALNTMYDYD